MGKKSTLVAVTALALLLSGIALAVVRLYKPAGEHVSEKRVDASWNILGAIPSDATAVLLFDGSAKAASILADSTGFLEGILSPGNPAFVKYLSALGRHRVAVSLHNSGSLVPLVAAEVQADSTLEVLASRAGLKVHQAGEYLLASRSETFLNAGVRQLEEGHSILGTRRLKELIPHVDGPAVVLVAHSHAPKLLQMYAGKAMQQYATFVKNLSAWSAWSVEALSPEHLVLEGCALPGEGVASYFAAFAGTPAGQPEFPDVLPYYTARALSLSLASTEDFLAARRKQEDGNASLSSFNKALKAKSGRPLSVEEWFVNLQPREAVYASFRDETGVEREAVLVRSAKDLKLGTETANAYRGALAAVLGPDFAVQDSVCASVTGRWSVFADLPTVRLFSDKAFLEYSLKNRLSDASVTLPAGFVAYTSFSDAPEEAGRVFSESLSAPVLSFVKGAGFAPAAASLDLSGDLPFMHVQLDTRALKGSKVQVLERDTVVVVPGGLFPVTNFATGKTNYLYQNAHGAICLRDENNKDVWGVPFRETISGRVQTIDFYNNKKLQWLFCAGDKMYLMDRLGRWVNGFPVTLPKPVLLGPDVYDFTGAGGYTALILHKDNTLERYNLHGEKVAGFKGIRSPETVKNLPELLEVKGKRYWVVRTSIQTLIYPFEGGEPLLKAEGGKMLKPDALLTPTSKGVSAECYDGKTREIKLN